MAENIEELFSEEDVNELEQIQKLRRNILKNIGIKNFIDLIRDLIDQSDDFEFTSASKRKFININTPIFVIRKKNYTYKASNAEQEDNEINQIVKDITYQILDKTTNSILSIIETDEELKELYGNINENLKGLLWTTVFEVKVSLEDNIIYLRYCI